MFKLHVSLIWRLLFFLFSTTSKNMFSSFSVKEEPSKEKGTGKWPFAQ